jgi:hypothetical protein
MNAATPWFPSFHAWKVAQCAKRGVSKNEYRFHSRGKVNDGRTGPVDPMGTVGVFRISQ